MKKFVKKLSTFVLTAVMMFALSAPLQVYAIAIDTTDGSTDDWADKPGTYTYNWNKEGYSTDTMHYFQAYNGNDGIAGHIVFSADYYAGVNGDDYNFYFAEGSTKFRFTDENGNTITNNVNNMAPGTYTIHLKHGGGAVSGANVEGATATLYIPENGVNPEIEFHIPYDAFSFQNSSINANDASSVEIFSPNIMCDKYYIEGAPTGSIFSAIAGLGLAGVFFLKKSGRLDSLKNKKTKV